MLVIIIIKIVTLYHSWSVSYPELFWSGYTGLGSQTQTPKLSKVLRVWGSENHGSNVLSHSERKIAKLFRAFTPGPHWGGLTMPPKLSSCTMVFFYDRLIEKPAPQKICWLSTVLYFVNVEVQKSANETLYVYIFPNFTHNIFWS